MVREKNEERREINQEFLVHLLNMMMRWMFIRLVIYILFNLITCYVAFNIYFCLCSYFPMTGVPFIITKE